MALHVHPVLLWRDAQGGVTAALLADHERAAAYGATERDALRQLTELLQWRAVREPWHISPELRDPSLFQVKAPVRARYLVGERAAPVPETVTLRVPCVSGKTSSGSLICEAPHFRISFLYSEQQDLEELIRHYVWDALRHSTPAELLAQLPPDDPWLGSVSVREVDDSKKSPLSSRADIRQISTVADPLLQDWARGSAAYSREKEVDLVMGKIQEERANVLLVGDSGIGKSTILLNAARKIAKLPGEKEESELRRWRFWRGSGARMIAGMKFLGEWEQRCEHFVENLSGIGGVLCVENLLELIRIGGCGPGDSVGAFLLPYLERRELHMAAEATPAELDACRRLMPALLDAFHVVRVDRLDDARAETALQQVVHGCASSGRLDFDPGVCRHVLHWHQRFCPYAAMPGPAAIFLRKLAEQARRRPPEDGQALRRIGVADALGLFIRQTGLPERLLRDDLPLPPAEVRTVLSAQIIGQEEALDAAVRVIAKLKAGLCDPGRPVGVLLFCGPTGVGKTALARAMADFCFGAGAEKERLIRLDMSEYGGWDGAWRLQNSAEGHAAPWIERVRRQPFSVVLFDEIEKAHPDVFDILLSLLDEGRLTDRYGTVTNFRSAIILLTSNLGGSAKDPIGFGASASSGGYESAAVKFFRPEFFNRLDGVVTFHRLGAEHVRQIAVKELQDLASREGLAASRLKLRWTDRLIDALVRSGYDAKYGARPLQRQMERRVTAPLARWRLAHPEAADLTLDIDVDETGEKTVLSV